MAKNRSYKIDCPACARHNYWITEYNGLGFCFNCGHWTRDGKAQYKPKARSKHLSEIRNFYNQVSDYYHTALDGKARKFLLQRGFTDKTIETFKIGYCPAGMHPMYKGSIAKEAGLSTNLNTGFLAERITFPYFYTADTIVDIRGRAIDPSEELRYKSPYHDAFYRGADYPYNYHLRDNKRIILTEGEIKADIATQIQYPAMALPGIMSWREGILEDPSIEYIIIFDSQKRHMNDVRRAIIRIAEKIKNPLIGTLPLFGKEKQDIDSFILEYGISTFADVVNTALPFDEWKGLQRF